jgi:lipoprotein-releasing system permease protein
LNTALNIALKISFPKQKSYTGFIVKLSIAATALSVAAIILTLSIVNGFQERISNKVFQFWGHVRINSVNGAPIEINLNASFNKLPFIKTHTPFLNQSSVLSYRQDIEGVVVKGVPTNSAIAFLNKGKWLENKPDSAKNGIVISDALANKLNIPIDSTIRLYFMTNGSVQQRKMKVTGLYHTGIEEYDRQFVFADINLIQQLNQNSQQIEGYEVFLNDGIDVAYATNEIQKNLPENLVATSISDYYPQIFDWINVQTVNRNVTITILLIIAVVNLLTCLFILMLERVNMIGTLTAIGGSHGFIRTIFLYQASIICWIGISLGAIIGIGISLLQQKFGFIQLDEAAYFIKILPVKMYFNQIMLVMIGTAVISYISFLIPTLWIKRIPPAKAIKFD